MKEKSKHLRSIICVILNVIFRQRTEKQIDTPILQQIQFAQITKHSHPSLEAETIQSLVDDMGLLLTDYNHQWSDELRKKYEIVTCWFRKEIDSSALN